MFFRYSILNIQTKILTPYPRTSIFTLNVSVKAFATQVGLNVTYIEISEDKVFWVLAS